VQDQIQKEPSMSQVTRRDTIKMAAVAGVASVGVLMIPSPAAAEGFLEGTWIVRCEDGHDDKVEDITRNHTCECGKKSVDGGTAIVVCPDGHGGKENKVEGITRQHQCQHPLPGGGICGKQCRR